MIALSVRYQPPTSVAFEGSVIVTPLPQDLETAACEVLGHSPINVLLDTVLVRVQTDVLVAISRQVGFHPTLDQLTSYLSDTIHSAWGRWIDPHEQNLSIHVISQNASDYADRITPMAQDRKTIVLPLNELQLTAIVTLSDEPTGFEQERFFKLRNAALTSTQRDSYRQILRTLNQALADSMANLSAQTGLIGLRQVAMAVMARVDAAPVTGQTIPALQSQEIRQDMVQLEQQLRREISSTQDSGLKTQLLTSLAQLQDMRKADMAPQQAQQATATVLQQQTQQSPHQPIEPLPAPSAASAAVLGTAEPISIETRQVSQTTTLPAAATVEAATAVTSIVAETFAQISALQDTTVTMDPTAVASTISIETSPTQVTNYQAPAMAVPHTVTVAEATQPVENATPAATPTTTHTTTETTLQPQAQATQEPPPVGAPATSEPASVEPAATAPVTTPPFVAEASVAPAPVHMAATVITPVAAETTPTVAAVQQAAVETKAEVISEAIPAAAPAATDPIPTATSTEPAAHTADQSRTDHPHTDTSRANEPPRSDEERRQMSTPDEPTRQSRIDTFQPFVDQQKPQQPSQPIYVAPTDNGGGWNPTSINTKPIGGSNPVKDQFKQAAAGACAGCSGGNCAACRPTIHTNASAENNLFATLKM